MENPIELRIAEAESEARTLEVAAHQLEVDGEDLLSIRQMERALGIRIKSSASGDRTIQAAQRLIVKSNTVAVKAFKMNDYSTAVDLLDNCMKLTEPTCVVFTGAEHEEERVRLRGTTLNNYGCLERRRGRLDLSLNYLRLSVDCCGNQSPATLLNMSAILTQQNQRQEAVGLARRAIGIIELQSSEYPGLLSIAHHNLAMALEGLDYNEAVMAYKTALRIAMKELGAHSATTKSIERNLERFSETRGGGTAQQRGGASSVSRFGQQMNLPPIDGRSSSRQGVSPTPVIARSRQPPRTVNIGPRGGSRTRQSSDLPDVSKRGSSTSRASARLSGPPQKLQQSQQAAPRPPSEAPPSQRRETTTTGSRHGTGATTPPAEKAPTTQRPSEAAPKRPTPTAADMKAKRDSKTRTTVETAQRPRPPATNAPPTRRNETGSRTTTPVDQSGNASVRSSTAASGTGKGGAMDSSGRRANATSDSHGANTAFTTAVAEESSKNESTVKKMEDRLEALLMAEEDYEDRYIAALKIQCRYRFYISRCKLALRRQLREQAFQIQEVRERAASRTIIGFFKFLVARRKAVIQKQQEEQEIRDVWHEAAVTIQKTARRWLARQKVKRLRVYYRNYHRSLRVLQCWFRQMNAKFRVHRMKQFKIRSTHTVLENERRNAAARDIQRMFRAHRAATVTHELKGHLKAARERDRQSHRTVAARRIQSLWRCHVAKARTQEVRQEATALFKYNERAELRRHSAIVLQAFARGCIDRERVAPLRQKMEEKKLERQAAAREAAATRIQRLARKAAARTHYKNLNNRRSSTQRDERLAFFGQKLQRIGRRYLANLFVAACKDSLLKRVEAQQAFERERAAAIAAAEKAAAEEEERRLQELHQQQQQHEEEVEAPAEQQRHDTVPRTPEKRRDEPTIRSVEPSPSPAVAAPTEAMEEVDATAAAAPTESVERTPARKASVEQEEEHHEVKTAATDSGDAEESQEPAEQQPVAASSVDAVQEETTTDSAPSAPALSAPPKEEEEETVYAPRAPAAPKEPQPVRLQLSARHREQRRKEELQERIRKRFEADEEAAKNKSKLSKSHAAPTEKPRAASEKQQHAAQRIQKVLRGHLNRNYTRALKQLVHSYNEERLELEQNALEVVPGLYKTEEGTNYDLLDQMRQSLGPVVAESKKERIATTVQQFARSTLSIEKVSNMHVARKSRAADSLAGFNKMIHAKRDVNERAKAKKEQEDARAAREAEEARLAAEEAARQDEENARLEAEKARVAAEEKVRRAEEDAVMEAEKAKKEAEAARKEQERQEAALKIQHLHKIITSKKRRDELRQHSIDMQNASFREEEDEAAIVVTGFFRIVRAKAVVREKAEALKHRKLEKEMEEAAKKIQGGFKIVKSKQLAEEKRKAKEQKWAAVQEKEAVDQQQGSVNEEVVQPETATTEAASEVATQEEQQVTHRPAPPAAPRGEQPPQRRPSHPTAPELTAEPPQASPAVEEPHEDAATSSPLIDPDEARNEAAAVIQRCVRISQAKDEANRRRELHKQKWEERRRQVMAEEEEEIESS